MSARRGEVPFVATRVGRSNDAREVLGLAAELKIPRAHALGLLVLWEEMILSVGDALTGRIKGYTAMHIAVQLGWRGKADKLIAALSTAGVLGSHRGTFLHPWWKESITGGYAIARAEFREAEAERKRIARARERGEESGTSGGRPADKDGRPADKDRNPDINQVKTSAGQPPQPPGEPGGDQGASRWRWVLDNHPRARNSRACARYLDLMTQDDWALFQWVTDLARQGAKGGASYSLSKKRVLKQNSHQILANEAFLEFRPEWLEKLAQDRRPKNGTPALKVAPPVDEAAEKAARVSHAVAFVLAQLEDRDLSEKARETAKARFRAAHPDVPPPWELKEYLPPTETTN